jgi:sulfatase maturation enzyme AslB (radical SAM superfamily)
MPLERISVEVTNRCNRACPFCYNRSGPAGETRWTPGALCDFVRDCAANGVRSVGFGGGEPLLFEGLWDVLRRLDGALFRSVTSNGEALAHGAVFDALVAARPDKVHLSIHDPADEGEVARAIARVTALADAGVTSGINLLVARSQLEAAARVAGRLRSAGIDNRRILYLPRRLGDTPDPGEVAAVAGRAGPFQSPSCLLRCEPSERFCTVRWDRTVAWCSYTRSRRPLGRLDHRGLAEALCGLALEPCG